MNDWYVGAYWGARPEGLDKCASRLAGFLQEIALIHPLLSVWFDNADSRKESLRQPVLADQDAVRALLAKGRHRRDSDGSVIEELGYSAALWNGNDFGAIRVYMGCGQYTAALDNAVSMNLPNTDEWAAAASHGAARRIMMALIECWEPQWATWTSHTLRRAQQVPVRVPVVGWITFLSSARTVVAGRLPAGVAAEAAPGGTLVTIGAEQEQVSEAKVLALREALRDALAT